MEFNPEIIEQIEVELDKLETLDPADLPEPASRLVDLLSSLLNDSEESD